MLPSFDQSRMGQRKPEYLIWTALCQAMGIRSYVELGTGSAFYLYQSGVPDVLSIDINNDFGQGPHNPHREHGITYLAGDSHDPATVRRVVDQLGGPPECVFIDAGHAYDEVRADYELWHPIATRLVGFHDIHIREVRRFWEEICLAAPDGSVEITARDIASARSWQGPGTAPDGHIDGGGIGVIFKE